MDEVYTCVCGGENFSIKDSTISCSACERIYSLMWLDAEGKEKGEFILLESAEDFKSRIRPPEKGEGVKN